MTPSPATFLSRFRDPFSGLSHLAGAGAGVLGLVYLLSLASSRGATPGATAAVTVFGLTMILLYASSAAYHLLRVSDEARIKLRRLDHSMIPTFIAGSYTPYCIIALGNEIGYIILAVIWSLALAGLFKSLYWIHSPRWVTAGLYVLMGWIVVIAIYPLSQALSPKALYLLIAGGVSYSVGALNYAIKWPDPWPPHIGFHEIWHLFVLGGSWLHYLSIVELL